MCCCHSAFRTPKTAKQSETASAEKMKKKTHNGRDKILKGWGVKSIARAAYTIRLCNIVYGRFQKLYSHTSHRYVSQFIVISVRLYNDFRLSCYWCMYWFCRCMTYNYIEMKVVVCFFLLTITLWFCSCSRSLVTVSFGVFMYVCVCVCVVCVFSHFCSWFCVCWFCLAKISTHQKYREHGPKSICLFNVKCIAYAMANGQKLN